MRFINGLRKIAESFLWKLSAVSAVLQFWLETALYAATPDVTKCRFRRCNLAGLLVALSLSPPFGSSRPGFQRPSLDGPDATTCIGSPFPDARREPVAAVRDRRSQCPVPAQRHREERSQMITEQRSCCANTDYRVQHNGRNLHATVFELLWARKPGRFRAIPLCKRQSLTQLRSPKRHYLERAILRSRRPRQIAEPFTICITKGPIGVFVKTADIPISTKTP